MTDSQYRIVSYNIRFGGRGRSTILAQTIQTIHPDILIIQEAYDPRVIARLAHATGLQYHESRSRHSLAVISRIPPDSVDWIHHTPSRHPPIRIDIGGITIFGVHLEPWFSNRQERRRLKAIGALMESTRLSVNASHILVGDFNSISPGDEPSIGGMPFWIRSLIMLNGGNIPRMVIQSILDEGFIDMYRTCNPERSGFTVATTSPSARLDYVFASPDLRNRMRECTVITKPDEVVSASDHFPLAASIEMSHAT